MILNIKSHILLFYLMKQSFLILHTHPSSLSLPSSYSPTPCSFPIPHLLLRECQAFLGESTMSITLLEAGPRTSSCIQAEQSIPSYRMCCKKPVHALEINAGHTASGLTDCPNHKTFTHIQNDQFGPMQVPQQSVWSQCPPTNSGHLFLWVFPSWS